MAGVKGRSGSGGKRPGSGRPPAKVSLRVGDQFAVQWITPDGKVDTYDMGLLVVEEISRRKIVLRLGDNTFELVK
jgi:hypothetical protein